MLLTNNEDTIWMRRVKRTREWKRLALVIKKIGRIKCLNHYKEVYFIDENLGVEYELEELYKVKEELFCKIILKSIKKSKIIMNKQRIVKKNSRVCYCQRNVVVRRDSAK